MRFPSRTLLALPLLLLAAACGSDSTTTKRASGQDVYHVTKERHGDTIALRVGQPLAIILPAPAGSASQWTPVGLDASVLRQTSGASTVGGRHGGMIIGGSKAYQQVNFKAVGAGSTRLQMQRARTQREGGGVSSFVITVVVRG
jgi:hypothetical protein